MDLVLGVLAVVLGLLCMGSAMKVGEERESPETPSHAFEISVIAMILALALAYLAGIGAP